MPAAKADLEGIRAYILQHKSEPARRIGRRLIEACKTLNAYPSRGAPGMVQGTREITTVWPYVIVYRETPAEVQILRVWHGAQQRA